MIVPACICGQREAFAEEHFGLPMFRCSCGVLRQEVDMSERELAAWYRHRYYDGVYYHTPEQDRKVARKRLDAYRIPEGHRILDVGTGRGEFVDAARERGIEAWGQDLTTSANPEHTYIGPLSAINFPEGYFHAVTIHDVLEHLPDPRSALREIRRILCPGGTLFVDFPRFFHPSGRHHWKPIEHLWMLTQDQLLALLEETGFSDFIVTHPVPSKIVVQAVSSPRTNVPKILVPPGIGDGYWVAAKLEGFLEREGYELAEVYVHDAGPRRSAEFWQRVPFVRWGGYEEIDRKDPVIHRAYVGAEDPVQTDVHGFDYFLSFNGTLDAGLSLDEALPGVPLDWNVPLFWSLEDQRQVREYEERFGRYVVTAFWDKGFYTRWVAEFGQRAIYETLMKLADEGYTVLVTGASWDKGRIASKLAAMDARFVDMVGETTLSQLLALLAGAWGVFGYPAGSTLLGPYFSRPTVLLWNDRFPEAFWTNACPPTSLYLALPTKGTTPEEAAQALLDFDYM